MKFEDCMKTVQAIYPQERVVIAGHVHVMAVLYDHDLYLYIEEYIPEPDYSGAAYISESIIHY